MVLVMELEGKAYTQFTATYPWGAIDLVLVVGTLGSFDLPEDGCSAQGLAVG